MIEFKDSSLHFNGKSTYSLSIIKGHASCLSASGPINDFITSEEETNSNSNSHGMNIFTSKSSPLIIDFEEKAFEDHLNASTSHLKDDFSFSSSTSRTSSTEHSDFSSFLRTDSSIKVASEILDNKIDEIIHLDSNAPAKIFET